MHWCRQEIPEKSFSQSGQDMPLHFCQYAKFLFQHLKLNNGQCFRPSGHTLCQSGQNGHVIQNWVLSFGEWIRKKTWSLGGGPVQIGGAKTLKGMRQQIRSKLHHCLIFLSNNQVLCNSSMDGRFNGYCKTGRHNLRSFLAANSTQNYFLIARMLSFLWHSRQKCSI